MFDTSVLIFLFGIGLAAGSFLNVVILRFGYSESPQARSHCMACGAQIHASDLVPVLSFIILKGKCRACGSALSRQYPLVEVSTALLFVLAFISVPPVLTLWSLLSFVALLVFLAGLVALVVYDVRHTLVPMPFVWLLVFSATAASILQSISSGSLDPLIDSAEGAFALFGFFFLVYAVTRGRGMGLGDAYVAGAVGILLGLIRGIEAVMFAVWIGTAFYLLVMAVSSLLKRLRLFGRSPRVTSASEERGANLFAWRPSAAEAKTPSVITMKTELPFVPFLALGTVLAVCTAVSPLSFGVWLAQTLTLP